MSKQMDTDIITEAKPHTIKKFELIERYVDEWARKILGYNGKDGRNGSKGVIYIDCMCNSGVYRDSLSGEIIDGTALRVVKKLNEIIKNYPSKEAVVIFNDINQDRIQLLKDKIAEINLESNMIVSYSQEDCDAFLSHLDYKSFTAQHNTLLVYDPDNVSLNWETISPFLNRWGEVIINHMISDTKRGVAQAKKSAVIQRYQKSYQKNDIHEVIEMAKDKEQLRASIISIIQSSTHFKTNNQYIASFSFYNQTNGLLYDLIHCCTNIKGFVLMKKVAWKTFGDKSSLKNTYGNELQLQLDLNGDGVVDSPTDEDCYFIKDIAKYIYNKYKHDNPLYLKTIYADLDEHPVFPSDGYKNDIKDALRSTYGAEFHRDGTVKFSTAKGD